METSDPDHYDAHARAWNRVGPPLRPCAEDVRIAEAWVATVQPPRPNRGFLGVILGVTPELALMRWPDGTRLLAVDRNKAMIDAVWPAAQIEREAQAVCREWRELPLADASADAVVGDGCYALLDFPGEQRDVTREVRRVLAPHGRFVLRCFVRPERAEDVDAVFADLLAGRVGGFHAFKWRLAMALQRSSERGIPVREIFAAWQTRRIDRDALARGCGWSREEIDSIDAYRGAGSRLVFPTLGETRELLAADFGEIACHRPDYELGERCATLLLAPRGEATSARHQDPASG